MTGAGESVGFVCGIAVATLACLWLAAMAPCSHLEWLPVDEVPLRCAAELAAPWRRTR